MRSFHTSDYTNIHKLPRAKKHLATTWIRIRTSSAPLNRMSTGEMTGKTWRLGILKCRIKRTKSKKNSASSSRMLPDLDSRSDHHSMLLLVEIERWYLSLYQYLNKPLKHNATGYFSKSEIEQLEIKQLEEILTAGGKPHLRVKMISQARPGPKFLAKLVTQAKDGERLLHVLPQDEREHVKNRKLSEAYQRCPNAELDARDTLNWMIKSGHLASGLASCEDPCAVLLDSDKGFPKREDFSGIDFSFRPEYSRFMEAVTRSEEANPKQDFIEAVLQTRRDLWKAAQRDDSSSSCSSMSSFTSSESVEYPAVSGALHST
ncbi:hypothetical protein K491DRAFT_64435 [Lophiostoma macrostomum CBS 122681]|uniref:Uncharacterized protein n=1 Tax=Lophiostoma macrostomum CBS 122681 TaxID=1314788 RepID=A0A6A6SXC9_9PLEO|nr:hypothetical protein K491DRAFT_64435 [Lophiostoma macrostomum CBS 122681]